MAIHTSSYSPEEVQEILTVALTRPDRVVQSVKIDSDGSAVVTSADKPRIKQADAPRVPPQPSSAPPNNNLSPKPSSN